jgi:tetratricopeptide (TPR) repeat protein
MPKQRRAATSRAPVKKQKSKPAKRPSGAAGERTISAKEAARKEPVAPPPPPRKPAFYEALAVYESGVRALQRHDFEAGAENFRGVIQGYPDERELVERARLFLQVCERETARRPPPPQTVSESVYAATVALNAGDPEGALAHLSRALEKAPDSDHAHYIMAVALLDKGDAPNALKHLQQAITLNPDNRSTAIQDPDLSGLRGLEGFREVLGAADASARRRVRVRR